MGEVNAEALTVANELLKTLLLKGTIRPGDPLFDRYHGAGQQQVRSILHDLLLPAWDAVVVSTRDGLFLFPSPGNREIGMTVDHLRQSLGARYGSREELNLALFLMLAVISLLQGDPTQHNRMYVTEAEIIDWVSAKLGRLAAMDTDEVEKEHGLDITGIAQAWDSKLRASGANQSRTIATKNGAVRAVVSMLTDQELVRVHEQDGRIFPLPRLAAAFDAYYGEWRRKEALLALLFPPEETDATAESPAPDH